jgi:aminoglycoside 3-N-acetyltransferase I
VGRLTRHCTLPQVASIHLLTPYYLELTEAFFTVFWEAFDDKTTDNDKRPGAVYFQQLLGSESFMALVALKDGAVVDGLAACKSKKFEQDSCEFYIYDLPVSVTHQC